MSNGQTLDQAAYPKVSCIQYDTTIFKRAMPVYINAALANALNSFEGVTALQLEQHLRNQNIEQGMIYSITRLVAKGTDQVVFLSGNN